ncbi:MAG: tetratricopeptide repeat protein [Planctomycetota bacterium]|jgi:Flp pilus assembly protein TadD
MMLSGRRLDRVLRVAAVGSVLVLLTSVSVRRIWCTDFWWQWATGRLVSETGIPHQDVFSFTAEGTRWIELRWAYCYLLFQLTERLGFAAAIIAKWLMLLAAFLLAASATARRGGIVGTCVVTFIAILACNERFFVRPELVTYLLVATYLWVIARHRARGGRLIYWLPAAQILWTNLHTVFILGPVIVGTFWAVAGAEALLSWRGSGADWADRRRQLTTATIVLIATGAACLVNPYGLEGLLFPFQLFGEIHGGVFKQYIGEFHSPFASGQLRTALVFYYGLIFLVAVSCLANLKKLEPFLTLFCLSQLYLSATSIRNIPLFCISAVPVVVWNLDHAGVLRRDNVQRALPWMSRAAAVVLVAACLFYAWDMSTDRFHVGQHDTNQSGLGLARHRYPVKAVDFMREHGVEGPVFAKLHEGSHLLARGYRVFIDPRLEIHDEAFMARFIEMQRDESAWREAAQRYAFSAALIDLESRVVNFLSRDPEWALVYFDENVALYLSGEQADASKALNTVPDFEAALAAVLPSLPALVAPDELGLLERARSPAPYLRLGRFLAAQGLTEQAEPLLGAVAATAPDFPGALSSYAILLDRRGDVQGAMTHFQQALDREPANASIRFRLGQHYFETGRPERAAAMLLEVTALKPANATAWALLGKVYLSQDDTEAALRAMSRAVELDPDNATFLRNVAKIEMVQGRIPAAVGHIERLIELGQADGSAFAMLVLAHMAQGNVRAARQAVEQGLERYPGDSELRDMQRRLDGLAPSGG